MSDNEGWHRVVKGCMKRSGRTGEIFWRHLIGFVDEMGGYKMVEIKYEIEVFGLIYQKLGTAY